MIPSYLFSGELGSRGLFGTFRVAAAAGGAAVGGAAMGGLLGGLVVGLVQGLAALVHLSVLLHSLASLRLKAVSTTRRPRRELHHELLFLGRKV